MLLLLEGLRAFPAPSTRTIVIARTPQSFEKRQRERRKSQKRNEKFERRLERNAEKKDLKAAGEIGPIYADVDEEGRLREMPGPEGAPRPVRRDERDREDSSHS